MSDKITSTYNRIDGILNSLEQELDNEQTTEKAPIEQTQPIQPSNQNQQIVPQQPINQQPINQIPPQQPLINYPQQIPQQQPLYVPNYYNKPQDSTPPGWIMANSQKPQEDNYRNFTPDSLTDHNKQIDEIINKIEQEKKSKELSQKRKHEYENKLWNINKSTVVAVGFSILSSMVVLYGKYKSMVQEQAINEANKVPF